MSTIERIADFHWFARRRLAAIGRTAALAGFMACSSTPVAPRASTGGSAGASGGALTGGSSASNAGGAGTGGTNGTSPDGSSTDVPAALPFAVDQYYVASGFMGDGETAGLIVLDNTCQSPRPAG